MDNTYGRLLIAAVNDLCGSLQNLGICHDTAGVHRLQLQVGLADYITRCIPLEERGRSEITPQMIWQFRTNSGGFLPEELCRLNVW